LLLESGKAYQGRGSRGGHRAGGGVVFAFAGEGMLCVEKHHFSRERSSFLRERENLYVQERDRG